MRRALALATLVGGLFVTVHSTAPEDGPAARAMWLWDPGTRLLDAAARASFFRVLERDRIRTVWAQVETEAAPAEQTSPPQPGEPRPAPRRLTRRDEWRVVLGEAHGRGIRIEALDGDATWALRAYHQIPLAVVDAVMRFNRESGPRQQFDGVHLDIEPYLLIPWRFRRAREQLLREYLDLLLQCQARVYEFPGMQFGVDIPFWWGAIDDRTGRPIGDVRFQGVQKAASDHLLDRLDNVGIMNYRNVAGGKDGLISHGTALLAYADRARRARVWMGVETSTSAPVRVWFAVGLATAEADRRLQQPGQRIALDNTVDGFRARLYDDGINTHVGLSIPDGQADRPAPAFMAALVKLAQDFGALSASSQTAGRADAATQQALRGLRADREWDAPAARPIIDPSSGVAYPGIAATSVMLPKLTFAGLHPDVMRRELAIAEQAFTTHTSYAGVAIHHYGSYVALVGAPSVAGRLFGSATAGYRSSGIR